MEQAACGETADGASRCMAQGIVGSTLIPCESGNAAGDFLALQARLREAESQEAARDRAIAVFAHELRNQLMPLVAGLSILDTSRDGPPSARAVSAMLGKVHVMARLIDDLVGASRTPTAAPSITFSMVKVQSVLGLAADHMSNLVSRRSQQIVVTVPDAALMIEADEQRLDQLLGNLLGNASKFTDAGGIIRLSAKLDDGMVSIKVEDNGCGIESDVLPRVFELFAREERAGSPPGFGVGLAVVKQIVELHGGTVAGQSAGPGLGSVFTVRLPLRQS